MKSPTRSLSRRTLISTAAATAGAAAGGAAGIAILTGGASASGTSIVTPRFSAQGAELSGKLTISTTFSEFRDGPREALAAAYKAARPNVELVWELQDLPAADYTAWLGTQLSVDPVGPDIVTGVYQKDFRDYVDYAQYRYADNPHTGRTWDEDADWNRAQEFNSRGVLIGVPKGIYSVNWFYNKALFEQAGAVPPTTWTEFVATCEALKAAGITPISSNFTYQVPQWLREIYFDQYHVNWVETVRAQEGDWNFNPDRDGTFVFDPTDKDVHSKFTFSSQRYYAAVRDGVLRFDTPQVAEFVRNFALIFPKYATADFFVAEDPYPAFLQQQAAMMVNTTSSLVQLIKDMDALSPERLETLGISDSDVAPFEWGTFLNPAMEGDLVLCPPKSVENSSASPTIIHKSQEQTDLALDFMMFYISKAGFQPFVDAGIASGEIAPSGPYTITDITLPADYMEQFANIVFLGDAEATYNSAFLEWGGGDVKTDAVNLFKSALEGSITPEDFGAQIQDLVTSNLDSILERGGLTQADLDSPERQPGT